MSSDENPNTNSQRSVLDHQVSQQTKEDYWSRSGQIQELIAECSRALARGDREHYAFLTKRMREGLIPALSSLGRDYLVEYDVDLADHDKWDWTALSRFINDAAGIQHAFERAVATPTDRLAREAGGATTETELKRVVERALDSLVAIAEFEGVVMSDYKKRDDAVGFSGLKIGIHRQRADMNFSSPVGAISWERGPVQSLYSGEPGSGKTTGGERQFEDYYRLNFQPGRDCKCIDPVDFSVAENLFYDVEQSDPTLRRIREEKHDVPPDFSDIEGYEPKMEAFVPLTPNLAETELPYDTEAEEFVLKPFTIPASSISKALFVRIVTARVSSTEENTIRSVYEAVDREQDDWTLGSMVDEIVSREELSDKHKKSAIGAIQSVQDFGFVRRGDCEYALTEDDWRDIFYDTETITTFCQAICRDNAAQKFVLAWLLDQMWDWRVFHHDYPRMALKLSELWEYAPHGRRESDSEVEAELQQFIARILTKMQRKPRDIKAEIVADTQEIMDLNKGVRELFSRYCVFDGNDTTVENIFEWTSNSKSGAFKNTITQKTGEASIVGVVEDAVQQSDIEFLGNVLMTPPSHHHHDKDDGKGWRYRTELVEHEELRIPEDWPTEPPEDLEIGSPSDYENEETGTVSSVDPKTIHRGEARSRRRNGESIGQIRDQIPDNPEYEKPYSKSTIHGWVEDIDPNGGE